MVAAVAISGRLDFNPITDTLTNEAGEQVKLNEPTGSEPVSYTHLDVYKRQILKSTPFNRTEAYSFEPNFFTFSLGEFRRLQSSVKNPTLLY